MNVDHVADAHAGGDAIADGGADRRHDVVVLRREQHALQASARAQHVEHRVDDGGVALLDLDVERVCGNRAAPSAQPSAPARPGRGYGNEWPSCVN